MRPGKKSKILISSCVFGNKVRWNGSNRRSEEIHEWAEDNGFELVPICPENELFGTPRKPIRLRQKDDEVLGIMGNQEVFGQLKDKCDEIAERHNDVVGFIGISNSPSCGLSAGVKDRGSTIKAPMHQSLSCPTTEISSMNTEANRSTFLKRIKKYEKQIEIKRLHDYAVSKGSRTYQDPESGFLVMTSQYLSSKGSCCESGCRHCPWESIRGKNGK